MTHTQRQTEEIGKQKSGDVLKVLKLHSHKSCGILRTFKTLFVAVNHQVCSGFLPYKCLCLFSFCNGVIVE